MAKAETERPTTEVKLGGGKEEPNGAREMKG